MSGLSSKCSDCVYYDPSEKLCRLAGLVEFVQEINPNDSDIHDFHQRLPEENKECSFFELKKICGSCKYFQPEKDGNTGLCSNTQIKKNSVDFITAYFFPSVKFNTVACPYFQQKNN